VCGDRSLCRPELSLVVRFKLFYTYLLELFMPNETFKRWTADDIAKLKNLAQKQTRKAIAAELGRSPSATAVKAHQLGISLKAPTKDAKSSDKTA
jgi:hypothetical protein